jgi:hypothetical protein
MTDKYFLAASGASADAAAGSRVLWTGRCAVAEYAFEEPSSLPRWTLPEETEVVVTEDRVIYRDVTTGATGELLWPFPQHLRVQPGNRDTGRSATVTQIQLVCAGPGGTFPALVFAGGELTTVGDADRLANVLRQAIARYRVDHASELGIPAPQTRMLSRLVIGPEFNNYQGGEGQTVSLLGSTPVVDAQPPVVPPYDDEPFLQSHLPSAPASGSVPASAVTGYAPRAGAPAYDAPAYGQRQDGYAPREEAPAAYAAPSYPEPSHPAPSYAAPSPAAPSYAEPDHPYAAPARSDAGPTRSYAAPTSGAPAHAYAAPTSGSPAPTSGSPAHAAPPTGPAGPGQPQSPGWTTVGAPSFGVTPPQVLRPGFDEIARTRPARPADEATLRGAPDLEARAADLAARVANLVAGGDSPRTEMTNLSTVLGGPDSAADRSEQARRTAARMSGNSGRGHGVAPRRPADDEVGSPTRQL